MKAPAFDLQPLLDAVSGDRDVMSQLLSTFISSTLNDVQRLKDAIARNDSKAVKSTAHHLKGSLLEIAAKDLVELALRLEHMEPAQQLRGAEALWQELDTGLRNLVTALDQSEYRHSA